MHIPSFGLSLCILLSRFVLTIMGQTHEYVQSDPKFSFPNLRLDEMQLSGDGSMLAMSGYSQDLVYIAQAPYFHNVTQILKPADSIGPAKFGRRILFSQDNNRLVISGPGDDGFIGAVWVFEKNETTTLYQQLQPKLVGSNRTSIIYQGYSLACDENCETIAVGSFGYMSAGSVWIFIRNPNTNHFEQDGEKISPSSLTYDDYFAYSVALNQDGTYLMVGAPGKFTGIGSVLVFQKVGTSWVQQANEFFAYPFNSPPQFGTSISLNSFANVSIIGGSNDASGRGACWIFVKNSAGYWIQQTKLVPSDINYNITTLNFGALAYLNSVGDLAIAAASGDNDNTGAFWVWHYNSTNWVQQGGKYVGSGSTGHAMQGSALTMTSNGGLIGTLGKDDNNNNGSFWLFSQVTRNSTVAPVGPSHSHELKSATLTNALFIHSAIALFVLIFA